MNSRAATFALVLSMLTLSAFCAAGEWAASLTAPERSGTWRAVVNQQGARAPDTQGSGARSAPATASNSAHLSDTTVRHINEFLRAYGIPVVLSTTFNVMGNGRNPAQEGMAVCYATGLDSLHSEGSLTGN